MGLGVAQDEAQLRPRTQFCRPRTYKKESQQEGAKKVAKKAAKRVPAKKAVAKKATKKAGKKTPSKAAITAKALEIYLKRKSSGEPGDDMSDWLQAEKTLSK